MGYGVWTVSPNQSPGAYQWLPYSLLGALSPVYHDAIADCEARTYNFIIGQNSNYADYSNGYYGTPPGLWKMAIPKGTIRAGINVGSAQATAYDSGVILRLNNPPAPGTYPSIHSMGVNIDSLTTTQAFNCAGGLGQPLWQYFAPPGRLVNSIIYALSVGYVYSLSLSLTIAADAFSSLSFDAAGNLVTSSTPTGSNETPSVQPVLSFTTSPPPEPTEAPTTNAPLHLGNWQNDRNLGPWAFTEQPNKWGYLNNPRWTAQPVDPVNYDGRASQEPQIWTPPGTIYSSGDKRIHLPCGHWHKNIDVVPEPIGVNLFRVTDPWLNFGSIQSLFYDFATRKLVVENYYIPSPGCCGLDMVDDTYIFTMKGYGVDGRLVILDTSLNVLEELAVFHQYDTAGARDHMVEYYEGNLYCHSCWTNYPSTITKISYPDYTRIAKFSPGSVIVGSDSHLYQFRALLASWGAVGVYYPITGTSWSDWFQRIFDDDHSGDIHTFGGPPTTPHFGIGTGYSMRVYNNRIYHGIYKSLTNTVACYDKDSFEIKGKMDLVGYSGGIMFVDEDGVYNAGGVTNYFDANKCDHELNSKISNHIVGYGRLVNNPYAIAAYENYLIVGTIEYITGFCGLVILNKETLAFIEAVDFRSIPDFESDVGAQAVVVYDNLVFVGQNGYVSVFEMNGSTPTLIDQVLVTFTPWVNIGGASKMLKYTLRY